jgi:hypothetical protein
MRSPSSTTDDGEFPSAEIADASSRLFRSRGGGKLGRFGCDGDRDRDCRDSEFEPASSSSESANFRSLDAPEDGISGFHRDHRKTRKATDIILTPLFSLGARDLCEPRALRKLARNLSEMGEKVGPPSLIRPSGLAQAFEHVGVVLRPVPWHAADSIGA